MHISCVRGSPLVRTILVLLALVASGIGFARLTDSGRKVQAPIRAPSEDSASDQKLTARFQLTFSEVASSFQMEAGGQSIQAGLPAGKGEPKPPIRDSYFSGYSGEIEIDPRNPVLFLKVQWVSPDRVHSFAKLVVEADGKETFTHVFDAPGDIDDFVELPF